MAGHSKFKNIMHRKGAQDKKRSAMFSKLSREITVAAKMGAPDPDMNPRLRLAVNNAKAQSMPKDNIQRAIDKASAAGGEDYEEIRYEGYGPGGVALIVEALTDNRNRTATNVRTAFSKNGGNLGASGAVSHGFERLGLIEYPASIGDEDKVLEAAIEAGADDVESGEDGHSIWTQMDALHEVAKAIEAVLGEPESVKLAWKPNLTVDVAEGDAQTLFKLIDALDDDDDVQTVWGNYEVSDAVMEKLGWDVRIGRKGPAVRRPDRGHCRDRQASANRGGIGRLVAAGLRARHDPAVACAARCGEHGPSCRGNLLVRPAVAADVPGYSRDAAQRRVVLDRAARRMRADRGALPADGAFRTAPRDSAVG